MLKAVRITMTTAFVAVALLCIHAQYGTINVARASGGRVLICGTTTGGICLQSAPSPMAGAPGGTSLQWDPQPSFLREAVLGIYCTSRGPAGPGDYGLQVPYWIILLLLATIVFRTEWRERLPIHRRAAGLCVACGYDLRATPHRCPECGLEVAPDGNKPHGGV